MTATMQGPPNPGGKIRHSWRCSRRSPILTALRILDDGTEVKYSICSGCDGSDIDSRLLDGLVKPDPSAAAVTFGSRTDTLG